MRVFGLFAAAVLGSGATQTVAPDPPCGACAVVAIGAAQAAALPESLNGLDVLVRPEPDGEASLSTLLARILDRGGRPGLLLEGAGLPDAARLARHVVVRVAAERVTDLVAFDLKTRLTALRAALDPGARVGIAAAPGPIRDLLQRDLAPYADFVVSAEPVAESGIPVWRDWGVATSAADALRATSPAGQRALWRAPGDDEAARRVLADLASAALLLPEGLVPVDDISVTCGSRRSGIWLNPTTLDRISWDPRCSPDDPVSVAPDQPGVQRVTLATGGTLVRVPAAATDRFAAGVDVTASRQLSVEEIVARHQAASARQRRLVSTLISTGTMTLTFEAPGFPAPITISSTTVVYADGQRTELEQRAIRVNGLEFREGGVPRLPIIEPERVAAPPLTITLTDLYRYTLAGVERVGGTPAYVIRFEPRDPRAALFSGRAWIAGDSFAMLRVAAVQTGLRGPIVSSEQVDDFRREAEGVWLLARSEVSQVYEGAAHRTPIHRVLEIERHEINPDTFAGRRRAAYASASVMLRDTPLGYRYLRRAPEAGAPGQPGGTRVVADRADRVRTVAVGAIFDPNISHPLPFAGLSYIDFDLFGTGAQFNGFFGGTYGQAAYSLPSIGGSRWQLAGRAFGIASSFNDRAFVAGREQYEQNIEQRPAHASVWLLRPLSSRVTLRAGYELDYTHYQRAESTASAFVVPAHQVVHGLRLGLEGQRGGWTGALWWNPARRAGWRPWGAIDAPQDATRYRDFQRYGASLSRSAIVRPSVVARGEAVFMSGHDLDRFSRYSFGTFDNRLRGYPSALIRYDRGGVIRGAIAWAAARFVRVDGFVDAARVRDPGFGEGFRNYLGIGLAVEAPAPFGTLVALEWGYGAQGLQSSGARGTHVVRVSGYKVF